MKRTGKAAIRTFSLMLALICVMTFMPFGAVASENEAFVSQIKGGIAVNVTFDSAEAFAGGTFVSAEDGTVYTVEGDKLKSSGESGAVIAEGLSGASSLCITSEYFYCVLDGEVVRIDRETAEKEVVCKSDAEMMYVSENGDIYTLENDTVYKNGEAEFAAEGITRFCPTVYGYIYSTGNFLDYTVYGFDCASASAFLVTDGAELWNVENDTLVIDFADGDKMISVENLWMGGELSDYNLYGTGDVTELLENASGTVTVGGTVLTADEIKANDVSPLAGSYRKTLSQGVKNILLRARQMYEVTWTPLADVQADSFTSPATFVKGQTYQGIPYGQPVHKGAYVGFGTATIEKFVSETKNASSLMYTTKGENTYYYTTQTGNKQIRYCPYYSNDCSAFVSYSWGTGRITTSDYSDKKSDDGSTGYMNMGKDINKLEPGYAICTDGSGHIILIYDVEYDSKGNLLRVTTIEQVEPQMRKKVWGVGGNAGTLADFQSFMNGTLTKGAKSYSIIKYMKADSVTYTPNSASPVGLETAINKIELPVSSYAENGAAVGSATIDSYEPTFEIKGWALNKTAITAFEYRIDKGLWQKLDAGYDSSVFEVENSHFKGISDINTFKGTALTPSNGEHTVTVRAILKDGAKYEVAKIDISVVSSSNAKTQFTLNMDSFVICGNNFGGSGGTVINRTATVSSPSNAVIVTQGWCVAKGGIKNFEYSVDGGVWKSVVQNYRQDVYDAMKSGIGADCKDLNSFASTFDLTYLSANASHSFVMRLVTDSGDTEDIVNITLNIGKVQSPSSDSFEIVGNITDTGKNTFSDNAVVEFSKADASDKIDALLNQKVKDADYTLAEIKVTDGGKTVDIKDTVEIGVELPEGYRAKNISIFMIDADGTLTALDSGCEDGKITFKTSNLGTFAIVNGKATSDETATAKPSDKTETAAPIRMTLKKSLNQPIISIILRRHLLPKITRRAVRTIPIKTKEVNQIRLKKTTTADCLSVR